MAAQDLPIDLIDSGAAILAATDALAMQAQGAMWIFDHSLNDWRYYLVTSLVDTIGRRKTYKLLIDIFEKISVPDSMTVDDVHLGSPSDPFFRMISSIVRVDGGGQVAFQNCNINGILFDGIIYRAVKSVPDQKEAERIERKFSKRVKDMVRA
ncbi:hypothetical protein [Xanthobacter sp. YC-JY1]|uniref:hypothetical protein n=1 Tax=Xanthobacter sp. YC-JY1 TaxID=2419844 RepID=UPI001F2D4CD2|nr:hypothetical protein [Xanthobacter sp. YC-JY1]